MNPHGHPGQSLRPRRPSIRRDRPRSHRDLRGRVGLITELTRSLIVGTVEPVDAQEILDVVLELPTGDRAQIAFALLASLGPQQRADVAWMDELRRRAHRIDSGEDVAVPLDVALAEVRHGLRR